MTNLRAAFVSIFAVALLSLCLPALVSAQGYPPWERGRERGRYDNDYYSRTVRDAVRRVESRSDDFQRSAERFDARDDDYRYGRNGRYGRNARYGRDERLANLARDFRDTSRRLRDRYGNGRDPRQAEYEARQLVNLGQRIDRLISQGYVDSRTRSEWSRIRSDLSIIANAYSGRGSHGSQRPGRGPWGNIPRNWP